MGLLADYAAQLRKIADALEGVTSPATPGFDEAFYLAKYPDVAAAVRKGYFTSGYDHYVRHGKAEGRQISGSIPVPPPVPVPLPVPPTEWAPADTYANVANFREVLAAHRDFSNGIWLDNKDAFEDGKDRFGPFLQYYSWPDGTVRQGTAPEGLVVTKRSSLLASYTSRADLIKDAQDVGWTWAVLLDGEPLLGGFEASPPANYVSRNGRVERA
jgi:hypothetical protein